MSAVTTIEVTRVLLRSMGAKAGAAYAERVAAHGGLHAAVYTEAANRLRQMRDAPRYIGQEDLFTAPEVQS